MRKFANTCLGFLFSLFWDVDSKVFHREISIQILFFIPFMNNFVLSKFLLVDFVVDGNK